MADDNENGQMSSQGDITCPGPLCRVRVMILGPSQCGKTTLVLALLQVPPFDPSRLSLADYCPTEGVSVHLWTPFRTGGHERLISRDLRSDEHELVLELWDTSGRQVCQAAHGLFLSQKALYVIVYDVNDTKATESVLTLYTMVRQKNGGSTAVVVVGTKADLRLNGSSDVPTETTVHQILQAVDGYDHSCKQEIAERIAETRALLRDCQPTKPKHKDKKDKDHRKKLSESAQKASPERTAEDTALQHHLRSLEDRLERVNGNDSAVRSVVVSALSGKGLDELGRILLEAALDIASFPHNSCSALRPSTVALYDRILALRERDVVLLPWRRFERVAGEDGGKALGGSFEEDVAYLLDVGALMEFQVGLITFRTSSSHWQGVGEEEQEEKGSGNKTDTAGTDAMSSKWISATKQRYVCVHPGLLANAVCCCLLDDERRSFSFEAGRFWPKDSGFKHPDPQVLCKVLEVVPQQGLLRECLLPLLWQDYALDEDQVLHMLHVLQGLGLLAAYCEQKTHCQGLALPRFPRLSVHQCHALPLLRLLPDNRPQLNWTPKPFVGDIQVTWSFHLRAHPGLLQRLLAVILFLGRECSSYRHLWRCGVLLRVGEATVCAELQQCSERERLGISCRVNGDELGRERNAMQMLWVTLAPFLTYVRHFLLQWSGLVFKETIQALGQQFYLDEKVEPELCVHAALSLWHGRTRMTFVEGDSERTLDMGLLFPFQPDTSVVGVDEWLKLVMTQTDVVLPDACVTMTSSLPPHRSQEKAPKHLNMRNSARLQKKKKSVEIKWQLQEDDIDNETNAATATAGSDPTNQGSGLTDMDDNQATMLAPIASDQRNQTQECVVTTQEEEAEAFRLASGFVAAILASSLADYIAQEAEGDQKGTKLITAPQITAARLAAETAVAVQTGDIEGAASAVIDAIKAVKGNNSSAVKAEIKKQKDFVQSKLCAIV